MPTSLNEMDSNAFTPAPDETVAGHEYLGRQTKDRRFNSLKLLQNVILASTSTGLWLFDCP